MRLTLPFKGKQTEVKGFNIIVGDSPINGKTTKCDVPILSNERVASALSLLGNRLDYNTSINRACYLYDTQKNKISTPRHARYGTKIKKLP